MRATARSAAGPELGRRMNAQKDLLPMIPALQPLGPRDYFALLNFLWLSVSGLGAARFGWAMVIDKQATLTDAAWGVLLLCSPFIVVCTWAGCLLGIARHYRLI